MEISVKADIAKATKELYRMERKQIPFAASQALNDTAWDARRAVQIQLPRKLDRPTPWTIRGVRVKKSNKRKLAAYVGFINSTTGMPDPSRSYMKYQIHGGTRFPYSRAIKMPVNVKRNKFGNLTRKKVNQLLANKKNFQATIKGIPGIWQRTGGRRNPGVKLLIAWEDKAQYRPRFPLRKIVTGVTASKFHRHFNRRLAAALRTAR